MKSRLPASLIRLVRPAYKLIRRRVLRLIYAGGSHYCTVCRSSVRRFLPHGDPPRPDERCPLCRALQRHRLDWLFIEKTLDAGGSSGRRLLHVAPEASMRERFRAIPGLQYVAGDLASPLAQVRMDLTKIPFPDEVFDAIYCSHVLEHVEDDRKAIRELRRVCRRNGWAILQVPITADSTFEAPQVRDPEERRKLFGQHDHVRRYGPDYVERLEEGGFIVETVLARDQLSDSECARIGVGGDRLIFFCRPEPDERA